MGPSLMGEWMIKDLTFNGFRRVARKRQGAAPWGFGRLWGFVSAFVDEFLTPRWWWQLEYLLCFMVGWLENEGSLDFLGGGFIFFNFHPDPWGRWIHFDEHIFGNGLVQPPTSSSWELCWWKWYELWFAHQSLPKDPFVCPRKGISSTILWPGDGIETINPALGRGLDSSGVYIYIYAVYIIYIYAYIIIIFHTSALLYTITIYLDVQIPNSMPSSNQIYKVFGIS